MRLCLYIASRSLACCSAFWSAAAPIAAPTIAPPAIPVIAPMSLPRHPPLMPPTADPSIVPSCAPTTAPVPVYVPQLLVSITATPIITIIVFFIRLIRFVNKVNYSSKELKSSSISKKNFSSRPKGSTYSPPSSSALAFTITREPVIRVFFDAKVITISVGFVYEFLITLSVSTLFDHLFTSIHYLQTFGSTFYLLPQ